MSIHTNNLNNEISVYMEESNNKYLIEMVLTLSIIALIFLNIFALTKQGAGLQKETLIQEVIVFEQLFQLSSEGILIVSQQGDILFMNPVTEKMMGIEIHLYFGENGRFKLTTIKENIIYQNKDSYIFFITDMTQQYIQSSKLEQFTLYDDPTMLPNRRKMTYDIDILVHEGIQSLV